MGRTVRWVVEECGVEDTHAVVPALLAQVPHRTARLQALAALAHLPDLLCGESTVKHGVPVPQEPLRGRASWPLCGRADARGQSARAEGRGQKQRHHARWPVVRAENSSELPCQQAAPVCMRSALRTRHRGRWNGHAAEPALLTQA